MTLMASEFLLNDNITNECENRFHLKFPGNPIGASLKGQYLTVFTLNGFVKVYDVSRHEPKLLTPSKSGYDLFGNFGEIIMAKCNATATHVAITIASESLVPDGKVYIWDVERDIVGEYDFLLKNKIADEQKNDIFVTKPTDLVPRYVNVSISQHSSQYIFVSSFHFNHL